MTYSAVGADTEHSHGQYRRGVRAGHHWVQAWGRVEGGDAPVVAAIPCLREGFILLPSVVFLAWGLIALIKWLILYFFFEFSLKTN